MKIPEPRKLPSGSWYVRVQIGREVYNITKPTKTACLKEACALKAGLKSIQKAKKSTLTSAIDRYIEVRENILSPSTIRGYRAVQKNRFKTLMNENVNELRPERCQKAVNLEAKLCSAKTLTNAWRFIASVIYEETDERINVRLPQIVKPDRPWLTPEQIPVFVEAIKGQPIEIPALLALSSLRRSEILALKWKNIDFKKGTIKVTGAAVYDEEGKLIQKAENKNLTSSRIIPIIPQLLDALTDATHTSEYVCSMSPSAIYANINRVCESVDLPKVGIHGLRHSFASLAYHIGMPEKVAMQIGGWADNQTMHKIYTHIAQEEISKQAAAMTQFYQNCYE